INDALKKSGAVAFDAMSAEEENPSSHEQREPQLPSQHREQHQRRNHQRDANPVTHFVPTIGMLVIVSGHVVRECWHAHLNRFCASIIYLFAIFAGMQNSENGARTRGKVAIAAVSGGLTQPR